MKIIEHGTPPPNVDPWWFKIELECWRCHCKFQLEKQGDTFTVTQARTPNGPAILVTHCPEEWCGATVRRGKHGAAIS